MKCQIQWIDPETGKRTPDDNDAVAMAHAHKAEWLLPNGGITNRIVGYSETVERSFPICAHHLAMAQEMALDRARLGPRPGWSFTPLSDGEVN